MDDVDLLALNYLMENGRASWSELSGILDLSAPSTADRVKKLEENGAIKAYAALINPESVGCHVLAFIAVVLEHPRFRSEFIDMVNKLPAVQECHHITGDYDYMLKIRCQSTMELERLLTNELKDFGGVSKTQTIIALSTVKESVKVPIKNQVMKTASQRQSQQ
jgi:Lrp/AsnC family leucine-responsive transcriptional regulator